MKLLSLPNIMIFVNFLFPCIAFSAILPSEFTPAQEARIGEVAEQYFLNHPEVLIKIGHHLEKKQRDEQIKLMTAAVLENQSALLNDKGTPSYGPENAAINVVMFFDYQCIYCAKLAPELEKIMKINPNVRFIFKEWPIFSERWSSSLKAATIGLQIWKQKGEDAYLSYHNSLYATGHNEGKLTYDDIKMASENVKFDAKSSSNVQGTLEAINILAQRIGFSGTPALVVLPSMNASINNVTVIPGFTSSTTLQTAIEKAQGSIGSN